MGNFILDTSGVIYGDHDWVSPDGTRWTDLDPFTQGYIEALFASDWHGPGVLGTDLDTTHAVFSDLAPETLALILRDCEAFTATLVGLDPFLRDAPRNDQPLANWLKQRGTEREAGTAFWAIRNGDRDAFIKANVVHIAIALKMNVVAHPFPPLTAYLGDDGKVYLRESK